MLTVTSTTTRPSTSIIWFTDTPDGAKITALHSDPLIIGKETIVSADSLTKTSKLQFDSHENYQAWIAKVIALDANLLLRRNEYLVTNGMSSKIEETIDNGVPVLERLI